MILDTLRKFIEQEFPLVSNKLIAMNYLEQAPQSYTVDTVPAVPVVAHYPDGGSLRQYLFVFASREFYDAQVEQNAEISAFYQAFSDWVEELNRTGHFPDLGEGYLVRRIEILSCGYLHESDMTSARYQIQCRMLYEKEGVL